MNWDKLLPAVTGLLGVLIGSLTLVLGGWTESQKQLAIQRSNTLVEFAEKAWGSSPTDSLDYSRKVSGLTVFADKEILQAYAPYTKLGCASNGDRTYECRLQWAKVVNAMRESAALEPIETDILIYILWGDLGAK